MRVAQTLFGQRMVLVFFSLLRDTGSGEEDHDEQARGKGGEQSHEMSLPWYPLLEQVGGRDRCHTPLSGPTVDHRVVELGLVRL
jgi:hypothetical protein